jgi:hypothetical protein
VKLQQLFDRGLRAFAVLSRVEPPEQATDVHDARNADDRKRMMRAEGRLPVDIAADEERLAGRGDGRVVDHDPAIVFGFTNK